MKSRRFSPSFFFFLPPPILITILTLISIDWWNLGGFSPPSPSQSWPHLNCRWCESWRNPPRPTTPAKLSTEWTGSTWATWPSTRWRSQWEEKTIPVLQVTKKIGQVLGGSGDAGACHQLVNHLVQLGYKVALTRFFREIIFWFPPSRSLRALTVRPGRSCLRPGMSLIGWDWQLCVIVSPFILVIVIIIITITIINNNLMM